jgi:large subunit ribosomal protein L21
MFAILEDGSRQYRVQEGDTLVVDYRADGETGGGLTFDRVLLANGGGASLVGRPVIEGASVEAEIVHPLQKGPKLEVQKLRKRKNSRRHTGHRQKHTTVRVKSIQVPGLEIVETPPDSDAMQEPPADES